MASSPNLSVPHSQDNPAPAFSKSIPPKESCAARAGSVSRFAAGLLLGFACAYVLRSPLTVGQVTIIAGFGILLLSKALVWRD